ncbi:MAG TPA: YbhB/YbcL family Raf kinase inhibitor-like protein [Roseiflexaceae bacterium]|nr:YbhB/YbcL family Raf kinase inhibitor-like protein [Roseiflexaceae bacterium]
MHEVLSDSGVAGKPRPSLNRKEEVHRWLSHSAAPASPAAKRYRSNIPATAPIVRRPLRWADAPDAQSFALIADDPDAPGRTFTRWLLYDIPGTQRELPEGLALVSALGSSGTSDFGRMGYGGPCPPRGGGAHRYVFTLAALDSPTDCVCGINVGNRPATYHYPTATGSETPARMSR